MRTEEIPIYKRVTAWVDAYGKSGNPDQRNVQDFMECETTEAVVGLRGELQGIALGKFHEATLDKTVGPGRKAKYGTYQNWAKLMILWIASYKG